MNSREEIKTIVESQRAFFKTNTTLDLSYRIDALKKLKAMVISHEKEMEEALEKDLGRHYVEAYFCDIGSIILEINETIAGLKKWARAAQRVSIAQPCLKRWWTKPSHLTTLQLLTAAMMWLTSAWKSALIKSFTLVLQR